MAVDKYAAERARKKAAGIPLAGGGTKSPQSGGLIARPTVTATKPVTKPAPVKAASAVVAKPATTPVVDKYAAERARKEAAGIPLAGGTAAKPAVTPVKTATPSATVKPAVMPTVAQVTDKYAAERARKEAAGIPLAGGGGSSTQQKLNDSLQAQRATGPSGGGAVFNAVNNPVATTTNTPQNPNLPDPSAIAAIQKQMRDNITNATGAQFDATGNITKPADSWYKLTGTPKPQENVASPFPAQPQVAVQPPTQGQPTGQPTAGGQTAQNQNLGSFQQSQNDLINDLYNQQYQSQLQSIRQQRDTALQGLNQSEAQAKQSAYADRNQADATNIQNAQRLREIMAEQGLLGSGDNLTNLSNLNAQRQSAFGAINQQEAGNLQNISERRGLINNNAAANDLALMQELQAQQSQNKLNLGYQVDDRNYRNNAFDWQRQTDTAGLTGMFNNNPTMARQNMEAGLTGMYNGQKTADQVQQDWQNRFNYGNAIGQFSSGQQTVPYQQFQYNQGQDAQGQSNWQKEYDNTIGQQKIKNALSQQQQNRLSANAGSSGGGSTTPNPKYHETPEWAQEISALNSDPQGMYDDLLKYSADYIKQYTYAGYQKLLAQAQSMIR